MSSSQQQSRYRKIDKVIKREDDDGQGWYQVKVVLIGRTSAHRAALVRLLTQGVLMDNLNVISMNEIEDTHIVKMPNGEYMKLFLFHFTRSNSIDDLLMADRQLLYRHAAFLCYDPLDYDSFDFLKKVTANAKNDGIELPRPTHILAVGAKAPGEEVESWKTPVPEDEVVEFAGSIGAKILKCSLFDSNSVECAFEALAMEYAEEAGIDPNAPPAPTKTEDPPSKKEPEQRSKRSFFSFFKREKKPQQSSSSSSSSTTSTKTDVALPRTYEGDDYDYLFKIVLFGNNSVKKTALLLTYASGKPQVDSHFSQIGVDFKIVKYLTPSGHKVKLQVWDTNSYETSSYFRGAQGMLACYETSDPSTFNCLNDACSSCERYGGQNAAIRVLGISENSSAPQAVSQREVEDMAGIHGAKTSTCCLDNVESVNSAFDNLVFDIGRKKGIDFTARRK